MSIKSIPIARIRGELSRRLLRISIDPAEADSIIAHVLDRSLETFLTDTPSILTKDQYDQCLNLIERRGQGYSLAVLKGEKEFFGLPFFVSEAVLIPRPETELLVEEASRNLKDRQNLHILDMGTGSGCILIALSKSCANNTLRYTGADVSPRALSVARRNAAKHGVTAHWIESHLFEKLTVPYDYIIANLPYLTAAQLAEQSISREPIEALHGTEVDGLGIYRSFLDRAPHHLSPDGTILMEIDPSQEYPMIQEAKRAFPQKKISVLPDLTGRPRAIRVSPKH